MKRYYVVQRATLSSCNFSILILVKQLSCCYCTSNNKDSIFNFRFFYFLVSVGLNKLWNCCHQIHCHNSGRFSIAKASLICTSSWPPNFITEETESLTESPAFVTENLSHLPENLTENPSQIKKKVIKSKKVFTTENISCCLDPCLSIIFYICILSKHNSYNYLDGRWTK